MCYLWNKVYFLITIALFLLTQCLFACGPHFPNTVLDKADEELLLGPYAFFETEMNMLIKGAKAEIKVGQKRVLPSSLTFAADTNDLWTCFMEDGEMTGAERQSLDAYSLFRKQISQYQIDKDRYDRWIGRGLDDGPKLKKPKFPQVPSDLNVPEEFKLYLASAIAWRKGDNATAEQGWKAILLAPKKDRRYRSTWAAYMLGQSNMSDNPEKAIKYYRQLRALVGEGFKDTLGLSVDSMGEEAAVELYTHKNFERATDLYIQQHVAGGRSAMPSLRIVACMITTEKNITFADAAASDSLRPIVTAYLLATRGGVSMWKQPEGDKVRKWLEAIEAADVKEMSIADRLAWTAYRVGEMELAERWLKRARKDSVITQWLRSKLLLRAGDIEGAKEVLAKVVVTLPEKEGSLKSVYTKQKAASELAALYMVDKKYLEALDLLARHDWWWDAAYIADRVLTIDELNKYVDLNWPEDKKAFDANGKLKERSYGAGTHEEYEKFVAAKLRYLLARRLSRAERYREAREYYPPFWRGYIDKYAKSLKLGFAKKGSLLARAEALRTAARIARYQGMALLGTELDPDWLTVNGSFDPWDTARTRKEIEGIKIAAPCKDELRRLELNDRSHPTKRFHYRYIAVDLAWQAAELMPDESIDTAEWLCWAGSIVKDKDPQTADKFYKALVNRCRLTELGKKADTIRWFPDTSKSETNAPKAMRSR